MSSRFEDQQNVQQTSCRGRHEPLEEEEVISLQQECVEVNILAGTATRVTDRVKYRPFPACAAT